MDNFSPRKESKAGGWFVRQGSTIFATLARSSKDLQRRGRHLPQLSVRVRVRGARLLCGSIVVSTVLAWAWNAL